MPRALVYYGKYPDNRNRELTKKSSAMDDATNARLRTLAKEYIALVDAMRGGQYADTDEYQRLSADRTLVHDELLWLTGMTRRDDMDSHCRGLLAKRTNDL
jgi:hypothetical protein